MIEPLQCAESQLCVLSVGPGPVSPAADWTSPLGRLMVSETEATIFQPEPGPPLRWSLSQRMTLPFPLGEQKKNYKIQGTLKLR